MFSRHPNWNGFCWKKVAPNSSKRGEKDQLGKELEILQSGREMEKGKKRRTH